MALDYGSVKDMYDTLYDSGVTTKTLPEWSQEMNDLTGTDLYTAGLHDNIIKRASHGIDKLLESTGLPGYTEQLGRSVGGLVGAPEAGAEIGHGLPRSVVNFLPLLIPGGGGVIGAAAKLGLTGALSGAEAYEKTDSPLSALLSSASTMALPGVAGATSRFTGQAIGKLLGSRLVEGPLADMGGRIVGQASEYFPETLAQKVLMKGGGELAGQAAAAGVMGVAQPLEQMARGEEPSSPFTVENLLGLTLGQAPFAAINIGRQALRPGPSAAERADSLQKTIDASRERITKRVARQNLEDQTGVEKPAPATKIAPSAETERETNLLLSQVRGEQVDVRNRTDLTDEQKVEEENRLMQADYALNRERAIKTGGDSVFGDKITPDIPRQEVIGKQLRANKDGTWRAIEVADDPFNPEELRGKIISYSTKDEPPPRFGLQSMEAPYGNLARFSLPPPQWRTVKTQEEWASRFPKKTIVGQPELPVQPEPMSQEELQSYLHDLDNVHTAVDGANTTADVQQAVVQLNDVEANNNLPLTNDARLKSDVTKLDSIGVEPDQAVKSAVKARASRVARQVEANAKSTLKGPPTFPEQTEKFTDTQGVEHETQVLTEPTTGAKLRYYTFNDPVTGEAKSLNISRVDTPEVNQRQGGATQLIQELQRRADALNIPIRSGFPNAQSRPLLEKLGFRPAFDPYSVPLEERTTEEYRKKVTSESAGEFVYEPKPAPAPEIVKSRRELEREVAPLTPEEAGHVAAVFGEGAPEVQRGFSVITADKLSHSHPEDTFESQPVKDLVVESAIQSARTPEATKAFESWAGKEDTTYQKDFSDYLDLIGQYGSLSKVPPKEAGQFLAERTGSVPWDAAEVKEFINRPHVQAWEKGLNDQLAHLQTINNAPIPAPVLNVAGRKGSLLRNQRVNQIVENFSEGADVTDAFGGSGQLAQFVKGAGATGVTLNIREPLMRGVFDEIKNNTEDFADRVAKAVAPIVSSREVSTPTVEGGGSIRDYLDTIGQRDPTVALFIKQNLNAKGREVTASAFTPTKTMASSGLRELPDRIRSFAQQIDKVSGEDGWKIVANAKAGDKVTVDPPYVGAGGKYTDTPTITVGKQLENYNNYLFPAAERGAKFVVFDKAEPELMQSLRDHGFTVEEVTRSSRGQAKVQPELIAYNAPEAGATVVNAPIETIAKYRPAIQMPDGKVFTGTWHGNVLDKIDATGSYSEADMAKLTKGFVIPNGDFITRRQSGGLDTQDILDAREALRAQGTRARAEAPVWQPTEQQDMDTINQMGIARGGRGLHDYLSQSKNPLFSSLAQDLAKFGSSLDRIVASVRDMDYGAFTRRQGGNNYEIGIAPAVLRADDWSKQYFVAHELVHGLTMAEIDNPTNPQFKAGIEDLRNRVINTLPTDMRQALDKAVQTNWVAYSRPSETLMPNGTSQQRSVLYGLLSPHEFVAQGLSDPAFRTYLQGVKSDTGQSWFHRFTNTIKTLLGIGEKVSDTAFEEFLSRTDQLMNRGNYVASFRNFSDRYFENLGMNKDFVNSSTQRAMGLMLNDMSSMSPEYALATLRQGAGLRSAAWDKANRDVLSMFQERGDDATNTQNVLSETGHRADHIGLLDLADSLTLGDAPIDSLDVLPPAATRYVFEVAKDARNIFGAIQAATQAGNEGVLNIAKPGLINGVASDVLKGLDKVIAQSQLHAEYDQAMRGMFSVTPSGFLDKIVNAPTELPTEFSGEAEPITRDMASRFLEPPSQIARRIPETAEALDRGWQLRANVRHMARESLKALGMDLSTMTLTPKTVKAMFKTFTNPSLKRAANQWIQLNNVEGGDKVQVLDADNPKVQAILSNLSAADRETVEDMVNKHSISTQHMQDQTLETMQRIASTNGGALIQKLAGFKLRDSVALAGRLINAFQMDRSNPNSASMADAEIQAVRDQFTDPDHFLAVGRFVKSAVDSLQDWRNFYDQNPGWSTATRYGKYLVEFTKNGKAVLDAVDSKKEAAERAGGRPFRMRPNNQYDEDRPPQLGFNAPEIAARLRQYEQTQLDILRNTGTFDPDQIALMQKYSPSEQFLTEETYRGGVPNLQPQARRLTKLDEDIPWMRNHVSWIHQTANYWSRQLFRAQARAHLADPEISSNPQLRNDLQTHFENILQPDTAFGRFFQRFAMTWFMGINPASALMNATQPFMTAVGELTAMGGKPLQSYRRILSALKEVYASGLGHLEWKDPVTREFMSRFIKDGEADISMFDDQAAGQELLHTNLVRMLAGDKPQTLAQKLATVAGNFSNASMLMFRTVERINAMTAGIAGYKYYRESEPNLSPDEAYTKAVQFHHAVNYGGGAANRPIGAFGGRGAFPRTVAMLATAMQSYNLGTTFQIARYIRQGFFRPEGLTPAEIHNARMAAVQMLGTQLVAAGTLGLPFVSGMLSVLNQAFPQLELNRKLRETAASIFGGDAESGNVLGDMAMTGVPSMLGWDMYSRLSMGNTVPGVSEINGFQPQNLLGAPVNLVSNFIRGGQKLASGDIHGVDDLMPSALKKLEQLLRSGGQVLDYRDRPVFTPTVGEKVGIALGFNPKRLSDFNTASRIAKQADDNIKRREGDFHQQMAEEVLKGNFGTVRQALQQRMREDKKYDPESAVRSIAGAAEELTYPRDLRREGSVQGSDVRSRLLSTFNLPPNQPSEVDRLNFRQNVQQRLGLMTRSTTDLPTATMMDQLRSQQPEASRAELRRQATLLLHAHRSRMFASQPE